MLIATRDIKEMEEFRLTYFMMTTKMKDSLLEDDEEIREVFRVTIEGQIEQDFV